MLVVCDVAIYVDNYLITNLKGAIECIHVDMSFMIINITKENFTNSHSQLCDEF